VDFYGQNGERSYEERQRIPGDYDAQTSQRPIAIHALENLTVCDSGVAMLRKLLRGELRRVAAGEDPKLSAIRSNGLVPTYTHDTVVRVPRRNGASADADRKLVRDVGRRITDLVVRGDHQSAPDRAARIRSLIREYEESERGALV
jgi:hypothetical protein